MPRVKGGPQTRRRRKKRLKLAKGQYGAKSKLFRTATESVDKGQAYAYTGRKHRKRDFRRLWITRISAAVKAHGLSYSKFMNALKNANVLLNRKMLSEMAIHDESGFKSLTDMAKSDLAKVAA
ncbi:MAG: 50S ribosomal protein L20 [Nitrospirae bacterium]|nr:50S ribosomal protein L20 [Nitrospirota bacterium]MDA1305012.1 50S ribosomal protein L20 [Nitrospirota bacterium]